MIVREAGRDDFENLAHLVTELGYPSSTEDMVRRFEEIPADPSYGTLAAEGSRQVLGMVVLHEALYTIRRYPDSHNCCRKISWMQQFRTSPS